MALSVGSVSVSIFHGVLREARYPRYVCIHRHNSRSEAQQCARAAKEDLKRYPQEIPGGWGAYDPAVHGV